MQKLFELLITRYQKYGRPASRELDLTQYSARGGPKKQKEESIEELFGSITALEFRLEREVNKDLVYTLMALYQKVNRTSYLFPFLI